MDREIGTRGRGPFFELADQATLTDAGCPLHHDHMGTAGRDHFLLPAVPFGVAVIGQYFAERLGCIVSPPFGYGVDIDTLCIKSSP